MGRKSKAQLEKEKQEAFDESSKEVIKEQKVTVIEKTPQTKTDQQTDVNEFVRRNKSVSLYKVLHNGNEKWYTESQILVANQRDGNSIVIPEGSDFILPKNKRCKNC